MDENKKKSPEEEEKKPPEAPAEEEKDMDKPDEPKSGEPASLRRKLLTKSRQTRTARELQSLRSRISLTIRTRRFSG